MSCILFRQFYHKETGIGHNSNFIFSMSLKGQRGVLGVKVQWVSSNLRTLAQRTLCFKCVGKHLGKAWMNRS